MLRWRKLAKKDIEARILYWEPLLLERISIGWRATKLTGSGQFSATAITVHAAQHAAVARARAHGPPKAAIHKRL
jgi:hypothetical protein